MAKGPAQERAGTNSRGKRPVPASGHSLGLPCFTQSQSALSSLLLRFLRGCLFPASEGEREKEKRGGRERERERDQYKVIPGCEAKTSKSSRAKEGGRGTATAVVGIHSSESKIVSNSSSILISFPHFLTSFGHPHYSSRALSVFFCPRGPACFCLTTGNHFVLSMLQMIHATLSISVKVVVKEF